MSLKAGMVVVAVVAAGLTSADILAMVTAAVRGYNIHGDHVCETDGRDGRQSRSRRHPLSVVTHGHGVRGHGGHGNHVRESSGRRGRRPS